MLADLHRWELQGVAPCLGNSGSLQYSLAGTVSSIALYCCSYCQTYSLPDSAGSFAPNIWTACSEVNADQREYKGDISLYWGYIPSDAQAPQQHATTANQGRVFLLYRCMPLCESGMWL